MSSKNYNLVCQYCGKPFEAKRSDTKYCTANCRTFAGSKRQNAELDRLINVVTEKVTTLSTYLTDPNRASTAQAALEALNQQIAAALQGTDTRSVK